MNGYYVHAVTNRISRCLVSYDEQWKKEVPGSRALAPDVETIKEVATKIYAVNKDALEESKRGVSTSQEM